MCAHSHEQRFPRKPKVRSPGAAVSDSVSYLTWILGTELGSSERAASVLNGRTISPATLP